MLRMQDKTCLVTGAASSIGLEAAARLAQEGAQVWLTDLNTAQGESTAEELARAGLCARFLHHDVTSRDNWETILASIRSAGNPLDVIVNNAGISYPVHTRLQPRHGHRPGGGRWLHRWLSRQRATKGTS